MAVLDASVQVALMNARDPHHEDALRWYAAALAQERSLAAPVILLAEVAAALARGVADPALARRAIEGLRADPNLQLEPVDEALAERAALLAAEHRIRGCDALYVALAHRRGDALVTLDRQQRERGAAAVDVESPAAG